MAGDADADGFAAPTSLAGDAQDPLPALCLIARMHHLAAEPAALRHRLGKTASDRLEAADILLAARHIGLKAKRSKAAPDRLNLVPLPALARLNDGRWVALAQCDGQRVLMQDAGAQPAATGNRPTIEPLDVFAAQWSGELILLASRASLVGELAKFDFS